MRRAVFLDRDGVLNRTYVHNGIARPPASAADLEILPGVPEALALLKGYDLLLIVVTNQPDVARGIQSQAGVEAINRRLCENLPLNAVFTCYHDDTDGCTCRKPAPGLLLQAAAEYAIDLQGSFMIGDRWSDVLAGSAAGCITLLINEPYSQRQRCSPDYIASTTLEAAQKIVALITHQQEP